MARDQVFVKVIIMEMNAPTMSTTVSTFTPLTKTPTGVGRIGFRSSSGFKSLIDPSLDQGGVLGFGGGDTVNINVGAGATGNQIEVTSLAGIDQVS